MVDDFWSSCTWIWLDWECARGFATTSSMSHMTPFAIYICKRKWGGACNMRSSLAQIARTVERHKFSLSCRAWWRRLLTLPAAQTTAPWRDRALDSPQSRVSEGNYRSANIPPRAAPPPTACPTLYSRQRAWHIPNVSACLWARLASSVFLILQLLALHQREVTASREGGGANRI